MYTLLEKKNRNQILLIWKSPIKRKKAFSCFLQVLEYIFFFLLVILIHLNSLHEVKVNSGKVLV